MSTSPYSFSSACPATDAYYSVNSEYGRLRAVLLRRPAEEIEDIEDPRAVLFQDFVDPETARRQHDGLAERLNSAGVEVHYIQGMHKTVPNLYFTRDTVVTTLSGAVVCRPSTAERRGEAQIVRQSIVDLPVPIVMDVWGPGTLEGGDVCIVSPHLALIGKSQRTNSAGANQLSALLHAEGFDCNDIYVVPLDPDTLHLDMILGVIDRDLVVVSERFSPPMLLNLLAEYGIRSIPLPQEEADGMALNLLCLEPGHVLLPAGNPLSRKILEKAGVACTEIDISELQKGGGGLHCMTAVLKRDLVA